MSDEQTREWEEAALQGDRRALEKYVRAKIRVIQVPRYCFWCSEIIAASFEDFVVHQKNCLPPYATSPTSLRLPATAAKVTKEVLRTPFVFDGTKDDQIRLMECFNGFSCPPAGYEFYFYGPSVVLDAGQPIKDVNAFWNQTLVEFVVSHYMAFRWPMSVLTPLPSDDGSEQSAPVRSAVSGGIPFLLSAMESFGVIVRRDPLRRKPYVEHGPVRGTFLMWGVTVRAVGS